MHLLCSRLFSYLGVRLPFQDLVSLRDPWCMAWLLESTFSVGTLGGQWL